MRWQYKCMKFKVHDILNADFEWQLNTFGSQSWELVSSISHEHHGYSREVHLVFKRPANVELSPEG